MYALFISSEVESQFWPCFFLSCVDTREDREVKPGSEGQMEPFVGITSR